MTHPIHFTKEEFLFHCQITTRCANNFGQATTNINIDDRNISLKETLDIMNQGLTTYICITPEKNDDMVKYFSAQERSDYYELCKVKNMKYNTYVHHVINILMKNKAVLSQKNSQLFRETILYFFLLNVIFTFNTGMFLHKKNEDPHIVEYMVTAEEQMEKLLKIPLPHNEISLFESLSKKIIAHLYSYQGLVVFQTSKFFLEDSEELDDVNSNKNDVPILSVDSLAKTFGAFVIDDVTMRSEPAITPMLNAKNDPSNAKKQNCKLPRFKRQSKLFS